MERKQKSLGNEKFNSVAPIKSFNFWRWRAWQLLAAASLATAGFVVSGADSTKAQITPDTTLGNESSKVTPAEAVDTINGGAAKGANLFHSFSEFNVDEGRSAYFVTPSGIDNIITRVTGANSSNILGTLGVKGGNANLFLLNPNGIVFGANARLDIGGSFIASTASNLEFADGNEFSTTASQTTPLLTVSVPIGLGFGSNPGEIRVQGNGQGLRQTPALIDTTSGLRVQPDQTLALVGGNLKLEGGALKTAGGRIELGSVTAPGFVSLNPIDKGWKLGYLNIPIYADIHLSKNASVDASGTGGGDIQIQSRQLRLGDGSQIEASTLGSQPGGTLAVNAKDTLEVIGSPSYAQPTLGLFAQVYSGANGSGGNINIETGRLTLRDGGQISSGTYGQGSAGSLYISARDLVEVVGTSAKTFFSGLFSSVGAGENGAGGNINIETGRLSVRDGGQIFTGTYGKGMSGSLRILARDSVELSGAAGIGIPSSLSARSRGSANAGNLSIETKQLSVRDQAQLSTRSNGSGNAGTLEVKANYINLNNQGKIITTSNSGEGGNIFLRSQDLQLLKGSSITTDATGGSGNGGNINLDTNLLTLTQGSSITANAVRGNGGNIQIATQGLFQSPDSPITATSQLGINGNVEFNRIENSPASGTIELPQSPVDATRLIVQSCPGNLPGQSSSFTIIGRGGLQPNPFKPLNIEPTPSIYTRSFDSTENQSPQSTSKQNNSSKGKIKFSFFEPVSYVQADTVSRDSQGNVVFSSSAPPKRAFPSLNCEIFERMNK